MSQPLGQINSAQLDVGSKFLCSSLTWASYDVSNNPRENLQGLFYTPTGCDLPYYSINKRADTNSKITDHICLMYTVNVWQAGYTTCRITTHSHPVHRLEISPASEIKEVTLISHRSTYTPSPKSLLNTWSWWRLQRSRPGCKHLRKREREKLRDVGRGRSLRSPFINMTGGVIS